VSVDNPVGGIDSAPDVDLSTPYLIQPDIDALSEYGAPEFIPAADNDDDNVVTPDVGATIDDAVKAEIATTTPATREKQEPPITEGFGRRRRKNTGDPKKTAPDVDEWLDFFSRVVIRFATEWYVDYVFRGVSEDALSDVDAAKLALDPDDRDIIARPYAEFAYKNPFMKKHGRQIVAFSDSFESTVILGRFYMRVNRIARKYRPQERKPQRPNVRLRPERTEHEHRGQSPESAESTAGPVPDGYPIYNPGGS
jgi:hypothetical protein